LDWKKLQFHDQEVLDQFHQVQDRHLKDVLLRNFVLKRKDEKNLIINQKHVLNQEKNKLRNLRSMQVNKS
jgi:hypothetical protein